jgi:hypothetical protein
LLLSGKLINKSGTSPLALLTIRNLSANLPLHLCVVPLATAQYPVINALAHALAFAMGTTPNKAAPSTFGAPE